MFRKSSLEVLIYSKIEHFTELPVKYSSSQLEYIFVDSMRHAYLPCFNFVDSVFVIVILYSNQMVEISVRNSEISLNKS